MNEASPDGGPGLVTLMDARKRNAELMRAALPRGALQGLVRDVEAFMAQVAAMGASLPSQDERTTAQNILDYWYASLVGIAEPGAGPVAPPKLAPFSESLDEGPSPTENPFREAGAISREAGRLPGREDAIRVVVEKLREHGIVFVTGPVGSGRSSLVTAGVLPQLENSASEPHTVFRLTTPGADPLAALAGLVTGASADGLRSAPGQFRAVVEAACPDRAAVFAVDNAEELFTRGIDQQMRELFAEALTSLVTEPPRHAVILIVPDDWVDQLFGLKAFEPYATRGARYSPPPPTAAEIQRVVLALAGNARLRFDAGIVEDLARELQSDIGGLALVRFMLLHLWPLRKGNRVTWDAYRRLGRPNDALVHVAEDTYKSLSGDGRDAAKRLFLALAVPEVGGVARSRRESRRVLERNGSSAAMAEAITAFGKAGLLRAASDDAQDDNLAIIHDALLFRWPRLLEWLVDERRTNERRLQFMSTAHLWQTSGRASSYLLTDQASVNEARKFADDAPELRELVDASDRFLRRRKGIRIGAAATIAVLAITSLISAVVAVQKALDERKHRKSAETAAAELYEKLDNVTHRLVLAEREAVELRRKPDSVTRDPGEVRSPEGDGKAQPSADPRTQSAPTRSASGQVDPLTESTNSVSDSVAQVYRAKSATASSGRLSGWIWIGSDQQSNLEGPVLPSQTQQSNVQHPVLPSQARKGETYRITKNIVLRQTQPDRDYNYAQGQTLGVLPKGWKVIAAGEPKPYDRPLGAQYWLPVEADPPPP